MNKVQILAPAGGKEQLIAAVRSGADAVYLGTGGFNARRNAENFGDGAFEEAVAYCHERGVEVHVTVNTLVLDTEMDDLRATVDQIARAGADAVIVQDLAVAAWVHARYPGLPMHASTQMTIHNCAGANGLLGLGFVQAVLARELSIEEIAIINKQTPIALEAFVHGALCMCVSGQCYLSSMLGGRSGNRGLCAQPCRTNMSVNGRPYALSLKDMTGVTHIRELAEAGVKTLKIEGRMKRPEYVAAAVTACRQALSGEAPDMAALQAVFSRSGFTDGYLTGNRTQAMFGYRTKEDVTAAEGVLKKIAATYGQERASVPATMRFSAALGNPAQLWVTDGCNSVTCMGPVPEQAKTLPLTAEAAQKLLSMTGGTPYYLDKIDSQIEPGISLPVSAVKQLRREALEELGKLRRAPSPYPCYGTEPQAMAPHIAAEKPALRLSFEKAGQIFVPPEAEAIILPLELLEEEPAWIERLGDKLILKMPDLCFPKQERALEDRMERMKRQGVSRVLAGNLGMVEIARRMELTVHGDYGLNLINSAATEAYEKLGLADAVVSFELPMGRISRLGGCMKRGVIAYGFLPLMKMRACPARGQDGCGSCPGINRITDAKGKSFILLCRQRRYVELLNGVPLFIGDKPIRNVDFLLLRFTTESLQQAKRVYHMVLSGETPDFERTGGLYYRTLQ